MSGDFYAVLHALFAEPMTYAAAGTVALLLLVMMIVFIAQALSGNID